ncbi:hypothetical protein H8E07_14300 [bacterium]|nr:hypothetical protein [bacterium]
MNREALDTVFPEVFRVSKIRGVLLIVASGACLFLGTFALGWSLVAMSSAGVTFGGVMRILIMIVFFYALVGLLVLTALGHLIPWRFSDKARMLRQAKSLYDAGELSSAEEIVPDNQSIDYGETSVFSLLGILDAVDREAYRDNWLAARRRLAERVESMIAGGVFA